MTHDPLRAATLLRDIFANERARVGFFIGAGCPVSIRVPLPAGGTAALIPDVAGLTTLIRERLEADYKPLLLKLDTVLNAKSAAAANIEVILSKVRSLLDVVGNGNVHGLTKADLGTLEKAITTIIGEVTAVDLPVEDNGYRALARWIEGLERHHPVEIFTTNYDLLIEDALEKDHLTYFDGFTGSKKPFFNVSAIERDRLPPHWTRLWKLHGSINWTESKSNSNICRLTSMDEDAAAMIHPSHMKYDQSRRLPYLALIDRLKSFIRRHSAVLVMSGYSFGDAHLNEVIMDGLESNPTALVLATAFGKLENYPLLKKYAEGRANLTVFADDFGIVGKRTAAWQADNKQDLSALKYAFSEPPKAETILEPPADSADGAEASENIGGAPVMGWQGGNRRSRLGDFASLGEFLSDVTGSFSQVERAARA